MPSPLAHAALLFVVRAFTDQHQALRRAVNGRRAFFYLAAVAALWFPDIDFGLRLLNDDPSLRHGGATHSISMGVVFGALFAIMCRAYYGSRLPAAAAFAIGVACLWAHSFMDVATWGNGVMLLWPLSTARYTTVPVFFGARHSELMNWRLHLITLVTELLFMVAVWLIARRFWRPDGHFER